MYMYIESITHSLVMFTKNKINRHNTRRELQNEPAAETI